MPLGIRFTNNYFSINFTCQSEMIDYDFNKFDLIYSLYYFFLLLLIRRYQKSDEKHYYCA